MYYNKPGKVIRGRYFLTLKIKQKIIKPQSSLGMNWKAEGLSFFNVYPATSVAILIFSF